MSKALVLTPLIAIVCLTNIQLASALQCYCGYTGYVPGSIMTYINSSSGVQGAQPFVSLCQGNTCTAGTGTGCFRLWYNAMQNAMFCGIPGMTNYSANTLQQQSGWYLQPSTCTTNAYTQNATGQYCYCDAYNFCNSPSSAPRAITLASATIVVVVAVLFAARSSYGL